MRTHQVNSDPRRGSGTRRSSRQSTVILPDYEPVLSRNRVIRGALWLSVALNVLGIVVFLPPALGVPSVLLPLSAPRFYLAQIVYMIALFAGVYAWLALQDRINRALIVVGALGKLGFFLLIVAYWVAGDLPRAVVLQAAPDLVLAAAFLWWASTEHVPTHRVFSAV